MRLNDTQQLLETALRQAAYLNSLYHGDPYEQWNNAEVGYVSACYELQQVETTENTKRYHFIVYVADRLTEDGSNEVYALDASEGVLDAALQYIRATNEPDIVDVEATYYYPFVQKFADILAGYYATIIIEVSKSINNC